MVAIHQCVFSRSNFRNIFLNNLVLFRCSKLHNHGSASSPKKLPPATTTDTTQVQKSDLYRVVLNTCGNCNGRFIMHGKQGATNNCPSCAKVTKHNVDAINSIEISDPTPIKVCILITIK